MERERERERDRERERKEKERERERERERDRVREREREREKDREKGRKNERACVSEKESFRKRTITFLSFHQPHISFVLDVPSLVPNSLVLAPWPCGQAPLSLLPSAAVSQAHMVFHLPHIQIDPLKRKSLLTRERTSPSP